jgi:hypothetical protein
VSDKTKIVPEYGSRGKFARLSGFSPAIVAEMEVAGVLDAVTVGGRKYVAIRKGLEKLARAAAAGQPLCIDSEQRTRELERKKRMNAAIRAQKRAANAAARRRAVRQVGARADALRAAERDTTTP